MGYSTLLLEVQIDTDASPKGRDLGAAIDKVTEPHTGTSITVAEAFETVGIVATARNLLQDLSDDDAPSFNAVQRVARRWYYTMVRGVADAVIAHANGLHGEMTREAMETYLHETIDGHQCVIYTAQAQMVVAASDNADAWEEEGHTETFDYSARAYAAMMADVWQLLNARTDEWEVSDE